MNRAEFTDLASTADPSLGRATAHSRKALCGVVCKTAGGPHGTDPIGVSDQAEVTCKACIAAAAGQTNLFGGGK